MDEAALLRGQESGSLRPAAPPAFELDSCRRRRMISSCL